MKKEEELGPDSWLDVGTEEEPLAEPQQQSFGGKLMSSVWTRRLALPAGHPFGTPDGRAPSVHQAVENSVRCSGERLELETQIYASESPGGPVVRTPRFHCRGHGLDPWSEN